MREVSLAGHGTVEPAGLARDPFAAVRRRLAAPGYAAPALLGLGHFAVDASSSLVLALDGPCPPADAAAAGYARIARELRRRRLAVVHERVFGSLPCESVVRAARAAALAAADVEAGGPVTYVQGRPPWGQGLDGVIVAAVDPDRLDAAPRLIMAARPVIFLVMPK